MDNIMASAAPPSQPITTPERSWLPSWKPTSDQMLADAEKKVLEVLESDYRELFVPVGSETFIHTVVFEPTSPQEPASVPLVMVHGFGCGIPQYYKNYDHLHNTRTVYSIDLPGFSRSTRVDFTPDAEVCEREFVQYTEQWRQAMGLDKFILLGHSLGGFLSAAYTLSYPEHVRHLVLDDPWGMPSKEENGRHLPFWAVAVSSFLTRFNPLAPVRLAGPLGPYLVHRFRPDLGRKFGDDFMNYVYHANAQKPSGETAFFHMQIPFGWSRRPMLNRLSAELTPQMPVSLIYGARSWMDSKSGDKLKELRPRWYTEVYCVEGAGHHVHADQPDEFNRIVNYIGSLVDSNTDIV